MTPKSHFLRKNHELGLKDKPGSPATSTSRSLIASVRAAENRITERIHISGGSARRARGRKLCCPGSRCMTSAASARMRGDEKFPVVIWTTGNFRSSFGPQEISGRHLDHRKFPVVIWTTGNFRSSFGPQSTIKNSPVEKKLFVVST